MASLRLAAIAILAVAAAAVALVALRPATTPRPTPSPRAAPPRPTPAPMPAPRPTPTPTPSASPAEPRFVLRRVLDTGGAIPYGKWFWDDAGVPAGPVLITVDLDAQVLSIFRGGYEIGTAAVIYGADDHPTPLGTFPILMKDADHRSRTYDNAPMPYTLRLTNDGVAIHGASKVGWQWASHGCVGIPVAFARKLFGATAIGDKVIITRGRRMAAG